MSVLSALALFLTTGAVVTNRHDRQGDKRVAELEARVAELEDAIATANAHARRDQELIDLWRERALAAIPAAPPAGFGQAMPQIALQQAAAAMQGMHQAQAALQQQANAQAMAQANFYAQQNGLVAGLLGAQNLIEAELWCNCVPARHDLFLRG